MDIDVCHHYGVDTSNDTSSNCASPDISMSTDADAADSSHKNRSEVGGGNNGGGGYGYSPYTSGGPRLAYEQRRHGQFEVSAGAQQVGTAPPARDGSRGGALLGSTAAVTAAATQKSQSKSKGRRNSPADLSALVEAIRCRLFSTLQVGQQELLLHTANGSSSGNSKSSSNSNSTSATQGSRIAVQRGGANGLLGSTGSSKSNGSGVGVGVGGGDAHECAWKVAESVARQLCQPGAVGALKVARFDASRLGITLTRVSGLHSPAALLPCCHALEYWFVRFKSAFSPSYYRYDVLAGRDFNLSTLTYIS